MVVASKAATCPRRTAAGHGKRRFRLDRIAVLGDQQIQIHKGQARQLKAGLCVRWARNLFDYRLLTNWLISQLSWIIMAANNV